MSFAGRAICRLSLLIVLCSGCSGGGGNVSLPSHTSPPTGSTTTPSSNAMPSPTASATPLAVPSATPAHTPAPSAAPSSTPIALSSPVAPMGAQTACQFQVADRPLRVGLCATFDQPDGTGTNSGDLNGTLWGVSRLLGEENVGQQQYFSISSTLMNKCGQTVTVIAPNDIAVCNGLLVDAQYDQHGVTSIAMYPKQPFDFAGRTGTIAFNVSNDSHGMHRASPELWMSDIPVPNPFVHFTSAQITPPNGFGIRLGGACPANQMDCRTVCPEIPKGAAVTGVSSAVVINNYISNDSATDVPPGPIRVQQTDCVKASSGPGDMNHFEVRISQNQMDVYATDAGTDTPLRHIAVITNFNLTLTRGLVWMEDVHYNGDKDGPDQGTHTFTWSDFGFDGPILPRDLGFDIVNNNQPTPNYPGLINIGWPLNATPLTLQIPGVYNIASASKALLVFDYFSQGGQQQTLNYRLNSGPWHPVPWPFGPCIYVQNGQTSCGGRTYGIPVSTAELQAGTNTFSLTMPGDAGGIGNATLILAGAGGMPTSPIVSNGAHHSTILSSNQRRVAR